ncbi:MAG: DUF3309 domain-containing protein [Rhizomicrobium sp.]
MTLLIIVILLVLIFGGGGGYYAHRSYGPTGCGSVVGAVILVFLLLWLLGALHSR